MNVNVRRFRVSSQGFDLQNLSSRWSHPGAYLKKTTLDILLRDIYRNYRRQCRELLARNDIYLKRPLSTQNAVVSWFTSNLFLSLRRSEKSYLTISIDCLRPSQICARGTPPKAPTLVRTFILGAEVSWSPIRPHRYFKTASLPIWLFFHCTGKSIL